MESIQFVYKINILFSTMFPEVIMEEMFLGNSFKIIGTGSMICKSDDLTQICPKSVLGIGPGIG